MKSLQVEKGGVLRMFGAKGVVPTGGVSWTVLSDPAGPAAFQEDRVKAPLVSIAAERDVVILGFVREYPDPKDASRNYTTTWFDMFRIENGKIVEHWDSALRQ